MQRTIGDLHNVLIDEYALEFPLKIHALSLELAAFAIKEECGGLFYLHFWYNLSIATLVLVTIVHFTFVFLFPVFEEQCLCNVLIIIHHYRSHISREEPQCKFVMFICINCSILL